MAARFRRMPYETFYVDSGKGVHKYGRGVVTSTEMLSASLRESSDEERSRKLRYGLVDFSETTDLQITPEVIRQLVEINRKLASYTPGAFVAIVAPTDFPYAMARLWQTFSQDLGWSANVFHSRPAAIGWLRKQLRIEDESGDVLNEYPSLREV